MVYKSKSTVEAATGVSPGCVLSNPIACIQMRLLTATFHKKIWIFEDVCERLRPSWISNGPPLFCCDML